MNVFRRSRETTREALLRTATRLMIAQGPAVSLEEIAARSRVSKSDMEYHFRSKGELITVLAEHQVETFRAKVDSYLNDQDRGPGCLLRAYVRASISPDVDRAVLRARHALFVLLSSFPSVPEVWQKDEQWWRWAFIADGISTEVSDVVMAAATGAAATAACNPGFSRARRAKLCDELLTMTFPKPSATPTIGSC